MEFYGYSFTCESDLQHHGIKGMKWGVRRYQNADGSLTAAGQKRYYGKADAIQRDIDSFKGLEGGLRTKSGKEVLSSQKVGEMVKGLETARDKARAKGDKKRALDAYKGKSHKEKLQAQNYQRYGLKNPAFLAVGKHYITNAKYWGKAIGTIAASDKKGKAFVDAFLDQPMHISGFTGTSDTTLRKRLNGEFTEWY